jgi:hypothetical protein
VIGFDSLVVGDYWRGPTRWMCRLPRVVATGIAVRRVSSLSYLELSDGRYAVPCGGALVTGSAIGV